MEIIMNNPTGSFVNVLGNRYYKLENAEDMAPFFINIASGSDVWMFMSSRGGLTAGRVNSAGAVFPYETDDRLHAQSSSGSKTILKLNGLLWEPFENCAIRKYDITRNIYKAVSNDSLIMEEINHSLSMCFSYVLQSSEKHGIVKTSILKNISGKTVSVEMLDGMENILPYGVNPGLQAATSTLVDAYKANELCENGLAVYSQTTLINDDPHPIEMLRANVAWTTIKRPTIALSSLAVSAFCSGSQYEYNCDEYGRRGAYFIKRADEIKPEEETSHSIILDSGYTHTQLATLQSYINKGSFDQLYCDIKKGTERLNLLVKKADGIQQCGDETATAHHYLNTLYNIMRGGVFEDGYEFDYADFVKFVAIRNKTAHKELEKRTDIKTAKTVHELKAASKDSALLYRLALEYMPLCFSRRHGDPSRPWNAFNIHLTDENGRRLNSYEGNWRDIFQNWEALGLSFPCYYENMIAKFVNASTIDGFNPYRINTQGIDWERIEPDNAFGGFGYWGDHQLIYLLRLLMGLRNHFPHKLNEMLSQKVFSYANVPYILKPYSEILKNSKNTIDFDFKRDAEITELCKTYGTDARLVMKNGEVVTVSLMEKLLVPLLSKASSLLCGGGIWMNTQRPEWNDANNAIVGIGLSMVTVYHMYAYTSFLADVIKGESGFNLSAEIHQWLKEISAFIQELNDNFAENETALLHKMGISFSNYREKVYHNGFSGFTYTGAEEIAELLNNVKAMCEYTINKNKRKIYSTYNLIGEGFAVSHMRDMLEGQSAVIGCGILSEQEVCELISEMDKTLISPEISAHYLYPIKKTTRFAEKNILSKEFAADGTIVISDINGENRFAANITTPKVLEQALQKSGYSAKDASKLKEEFERLFGHQSFTGRSQVMYKFEGIGCIYWHQNAKLALAVLETALREAKKEGNFKNVYEAYKQITNGFIYRKKPAQCGAIPIEPYSHTSFNKSCEQPGMTGQVKESVIMRRGELGVIIENGKIVFMPAILSEKDFTQDGNISFTLCEVPIKYIKSNTKKAIVKYNNGENAEILFKGALLQLDEKTSQEIFFRSNKINSVDIYV